MELHFQCERVLVVGRSDVKTSLTSPLNKGHIPRTSQHQNYRLGKKSVKSERWGGGGSAAIKDRTHITHLQKSNVYTRLRFTSSLTLRFVCELALAKKDCVHASHNFFGFSFFSCVQKYVHCHEILNEPVWPSGKELAGW